MYRDESHAVDERLVWSAADSRANSLLCMWRDWARADPNRLDYPGAQPFAVVPGGKMTISDGLAEKIDAAVTKMPFRSRAVILDCYLEGRADKHGPVTHLAAVRAFLMEYDNA